MYGPLFWRHCRLLWTWAAYQDGPSRQRGVGELLEPDNYHCPSNFRAESHAEYWGILPEFLHHGVGGRIRQSFDGQITDPFFSLRDNRLFIVHCPAGVRIPRPGNNAGRSRKKSPF